MYNDTTLGVEMNDCGIWQINFYYSKGTIGCAGLNGEGFYHKVQLQFGNNQMRYVGLLSFYNPCSTKYGQWTGQYCKKK